MPELPRRSNSGLRDEWIRFRGLLADGTWREFEIPRARVAGAGADHLDELLRWRASASTFDEVWVPASESYMHVNLGALLAYSYPEEAGADA